MVMGARCAGARMWGQVRGAAARGEAVPGSAGSPQAVADLVRAAPCTDLGAPRRVAEAKWRSLAAVNVAPVQRGYRARPECFAGLREPCAAHGAALVFDEVATGFRHARGAAAEGFGVEPARGAFGKALGRGGAPSWPPRAGQRPRTAPVRGGAMRPPSYACVTSSRAGSPLAAAGPRHFLGETARPGVVEDMHARAEALEEGSGGASVEN